MKKIFHYFKTCIDVNKNCFFYLALKRVLLCLFFISGAVFEIEGASSSLKCEPRWIDSLVCAGKKSIDSGNILDAKRYFAIAYDCGMSKDSMLYFAAETYMRLFVLDTALTFNWGLEKMGHLPSEVYLEQRSRIFRMMGLKHKADSVLALIRKKERYDLSLNVSAFRNILKLNQVILPPVNKTFIDPDDIIYDAGDVQINQRIYRYYNTWFKRIYAMFNISSDFVVPTRYSFVSDNDTAIKSLSLYIGAGEMPRTPELVVSHRLAIHPETKIDYYNKVLLSFSLKNNYNISVGHDSKWANREVCDNRTAIQFYKIVTARKFFWMPSISVAHHFSKVNQYENDITSYSLYPKLPIGYIDSKSLSDSLASKSRYYSDRNLCHSFDMDTIIFPDDDFWNDQPAIRLFEQPTNDASFTAKSSLFLHLPLKMNLSISTYTADGSKVNIIVALHISQFSRSPIRLRHLPPLTGEGWDRGCEICDICH